MTIEYLYITADDPSLPTGGGKVTHHELRALRDLGETLLLRPDPASMAQGPFGQDASVMRQLLAGRDLDFDKLRMAHVYAGCFTQTCKMLREEGVPITYTVAAHDIDASRKAHEELGAPFDYPHLNDSDMFRAYASGYLDHSSVVIVPGEAPEKTVRKQWSRYALPHGQLAVIPHGIDRPTRVCTKPRREFVVGYLGAAGPDKGVTDLIDAFREAGIPGTRLLLCGADWPKLAPLYLHRMRGACQAIGWREDIADFFDRVSVYVQPSRTEGFGIPVVEALGHGVPVLCSTGAGAADHVDPSCRFSPGDVAALKGLIREAYATWVTKEQKLTGFRSAFFDPVYMGGVAEATYNGLSWQRVRQDYQRLWQKVRR